jgi:hypothetical protein
MSPKFKVAEDILFRQVENEGILMHIPSGTYYSLSETSILFWEALSQQETLEIIIDKITDEYNVERSQVISDLEVFIEDLSNFGLITPASN